VANEAMTPTDDVSLWYRCCISQSAEADNWAGEGTAEPKDRGSLWLLMSEGVYGVMSCSTWRLSTVRRYSAEKWAKLSLISLVCMRSIAGVGGGSESYWRTEGQLSPNREKFAPSCSSGSSRLCPRSATFAIPFNGNPRV